MEKKYPLPPFTKETAKEKIKKAEDAWNNKDPIQISKAYTLNTEWRNRDKFIKGRAEVQAFLADKWNNELEYKLHKKLWTFNDNRIAVTFEYEYKNKQGQRFRAYGNENWEFDANGLMQKRYASINDVSIEESDRKL